MHVLLPYADALEDKAYDGHPREKRGPKWNKFKTGVKNFWRKAKPYVRKDDWIPKTHF